MKLNSTKLVILLTVVFLLGGLFWLYKVSTKPLSGQKVTDQGRKHIPDGEKFEYNSNPPTSGSHYEEWAKSGVYAAPVSDGHLVHSLEHGYIIMSYNCSLPISLLEKLTGEVYAHEEELTATPSADLSSSPSATLEGEEWGSESCKELVAKLSGVYEKKGKKKLIIIPRPSLDTKIALTAWDRIDNFNEFDEVKIISFIDAFRDKGPEKTME